MIKPEQSHNDAMCSNDLPLTKKPHPKVLNLLMKPSLSLTSLPPQSPKEASDETQIKLIERPYNSLKKKRDGEKEMWRRSWESQASISTTTSHTGTSCGGKTTDFWAAYNYIMDTNLIDSCREATGESSNRMEDVSGDFNALKHSNNQMIHFNPSRSQGSTSADPRRLRRWLREMESRVSAMPSITEAMRLKPDVLKKSLSESANLYREIESHGRAVVACIRTLEKENTKLDDQQLKSLECSEYDSLDTTTTNTTTSDSKRGENVLKALERRYHLLYLRAIEIQCMFEGLLERRSYLQSIEDFQPLVDTSDEEPSAKVAKFNDDKFTSHKRDEPKVVVKRHSESITEFDADSEGSEGEMECVAPSGIDCIDGTSILPIKSPSLPKTPPPNRNDSPLVTTVKRARPKDISKFHRSNRKSKNCAIFYYKHVDTDTDQLNDHPEPEQPLVSSEASEDEIWEFTGATNAEAQLTPNEHFGDEQDFRILENLLDVNVSENDVKNSQQQSQQQMVSHETKLITKDSLRELVLGAESLVRQKSKETITSKVEYFFNEICANRQKQQQQRKKLMDKTQKDTAKIHRVQEWLKNHPDKDEAAFIIQATAQPADCEASGEYTSDSESGHDTESSEEITNSVATCLQGTDPMLTSTEGLEYTTPVHKVTMRTKNSRRNSDRPWSVSCLSQLTRNSRQSLADPKAVDVTSTALANFSISESALNNPQKYKTTSESDTKTGTQMAPTGTSSGSKSSLRRRRAKLRKKSLTSQKRSESGSDMLSSYAIGTSLMEDLSVAISMMTLVKDNPVQPEVPQKPESDDDNQKMMKPDFKIGSITNVYASNLGSLAALATYNHNSKDDQEQNETGTENMSSFSEQAWDNYQEKYNSEAYSEDRDIDGARRLLDFGDDYRNFIDSQSDCCSSLSAANIDSLSPPRGRKVMHPVQNQSISSNENSMKMLRHRRIQELPEIERRRMSADGQKLMEIEATRRRSQIISGRLSYKSSSSEHSDIETELDKNLLKLLAESQTNLERTEALRQAHPQLLRPEDYDEIVDTCRKNVECLEAVLRGGVGDAKTVKDLIASWSNLLNWSENAAAARRMQEEIAIQKQLLDTIAVDDNGEIFDTEEAIREKIQELKVSRDELQKHRSAMLKLNASVHSWLTRQEMNRQAEVKATDELVNERFTQSDLQIFADDELHTHLKDEVVSLYSAWDAANARIYSRIESLQHSLICWRKFENDLQDFQDNLSKDRGALYGLKGAIEEGRAPDDLVDNVQQVAKLLSEKLESKIQHTISTNEDLILHPEAALQFIASSSGSLSDSGISDGGFSELSERERRLNALKKIAKQLESALSPSSNVLKMISQRMEAAENELKILQDTCRELIVKTSTQLLQQQGIDLPANSQSQINVQIPIITIKGKTKRSLPKRNKRRSPSSTTAKRSNADQKLQSCPSNDECSKSESDMDEGDETNSRWWILKRIARMAVPVQLALVTLFCVACMLEPRCCDTMNNLSMSLTPQLRYIRGPPPT